METGKINGGTRSKWTRNRPLLYGHNRSIPIYRLLYRFTTVIVQQLIIPTGTVLNGDQWMWLRTNFSDQPNIVTGNVETPSTDLLTGGPSLVSGLIQGATSSTIT